jgi:hypothetical protein
MKTEGRRKREEVGREEIGRNKHQPSRAPLPFLGEMSRFPTFGWRPPRDWETSTIEQIPTLLNVERNKLLFFAIQNIQYPIFDMQHSTLENLRNTK